MWRSRTGGWWAGVRCGEIEDRSINRLIETLSIGVRQGYAILDVEMVGSSVLNPIVFLGLIFLSIEFDF